MYCKIWRTKLNNRLNCYHLITVGPRKSNLCGICKGCRMKRGCQITEGLTKNKYINKINVQKCMYVCTNIRLLIYKYNGIHVYYIL